MGVQSRMTRAAAARASEVAANITIFACRARSICYESNINGRQFVDRAAKWAKDHGLAWRVEASRGKGGHRLLYVGDRRTTVQTGEIPPGTYHAMLKQLAIPKEEF